MAEARVLLVALDALPPHLLDRWCDDGTLPETAALRAAGRRGAVTSTADLYPGSVWPTFTTRSGVEDHGIFHAVQWDAASMRMRSPTTDGWLHVRPFWHDLAEAGIPSVVLDIPFSWNPVGPPLSVEVLGWGAHEALWEGSRPVSLLPDLKHRFGKSSLSRDVLGSKPASWLRKELGSLLVDVEKRGRIIDYLLDRFEWRVGLVNFAEVHRAGHWFWSERTTGEAQGGLKGIARAVDREIGRLRRRLGPEDHFVVFSCHGMGEATDSERFHEVIWKLLEPRVNGSPARRLDPVGALRSAIPPTLLRELSARLPHNVYRRFHEHYLNAGRDWSSFKTISLYPELNYYFYANSKGRERHGLLSAEEAREHLAWLETELSGLTTPDGESFFERIVRVYDHLEGSAAGVLPDLIGVPQDRQFGATLRSRSGHLISAPVQYEKDGQHRPDGFYIQYGPGVSAGTGPTLAGTELARVFLEPAGIRLPP